MQYAPCVIIADFEADNKKCDEPYGGKMRKIAEQKANSFCYLIHWIDDGTVWGPVIYREENATQEFVRRIDQELVTINKVLANKHERIVTEEAKKHFAEAEHCWICKGKFIIDIDQVKSLENKCALLDNKLKNTNKDSADYKALTTQISKILKEIDRLKDIVNKVWDHCHITGKFRGAAHNACNLKLQIEPWKTPIPIVFITSEDMIPTWFVNLLENRFQLIRLKS